MRDGGYSHGSFGASGSDLRRKRVRLRLLLGVLVFLTLLTFIGWRRYAGNIWRQVYPFSYRAIITRHAEANGLDPLLVAAVIKTESNFWTWARSRKDARGLMQLMPPTARWVAGQVGLADFEEQMLYDPEPNIALGCWYLAHLLSDYKGNLPVALAAWNGGRTNVDTWLRNGNWSGKLEDVGDIPFSETRSFVPRVLGNWAWYERLYGDGR